MSDDDDFPKKFKLLTFPSQKVDDTADYSTKVLECYSVARYLLMCIEDDEIRETCLSNLKLAFGPIFDPFIEIDRDVDDLFYEENEE